MTSLVWTLRVLIRNVMASRGLDLADAARLVRQATEAAIMTINQPLPTAPQQLRSVE